MPFGYYEDERKVEHTLCEKQGFADIFTDDQDRREQLFTLIDFHGI